MKTRRYSEAQTFRILQEVDSGVSVVDAARKYGFHRQQFTAGRASMVA